MESTAEAAPHALHSDSVEDDLPVAIASAATQGDATTILEWLSSEPDGCVNATCEAPNGAVRGITMLMLAASFGRAHLMEALLDHGAEIDRHSSIGNTALMYAAISGQAQIVELLVQRKANLDMQNRRGFTPLMYATQAGHSAVLELLGSAGANADLRSIDGRTALQMAEKQEQRVAPDSPAAAPPNTECSTSVADGTANEAVREEAEVDVLRAKMEAEQASLERKRVEREARRLARQSELAKAQQSHVPDQEPVPVEAPAVAEEATQEETVAAVDAAEALAAKPPETATADEPTADAPTADAPTADALTADAPTADAAVTPSLSMSPPENVGMVETVPTTQQAQAAGASALSPSTFSPQTVRVAEMEAARPSETALSLASPPGLAWLALYAGATLLGAIVGSVEARVDGKHSDKETGATLSSPSSILASTLSRWISVS
jgi:hypothetical protein